MKPLTQQRILVTGSTDGLGKQTALDHVTGQYFDQQRSAHAHSQAYDRDVRRRLRQMSEQLTGLSGQEAGAV